MGQSLVPECCVMYGWDGIGSSSRANLLEARYEGPHVRINLLHILWNCEKLEES